MLHNSLSLSVLPRKGSILYNFMAETKEKKKKALNRFRFLNKYFMVPLYRINVLPLFFVGRNIVLLYTKGRKSGKKRITPVEYRIYKGKILLFSSRGKKGDWYQNIIADEAYFRLKKGFKMYKPFVTVSNLEEKEEILVWYSNTHPNLAKEFYGYQKGEDIVSKELVKPVAEFIEILQLEL